MNSISIYFVVAFFLLSSAIAFSQDVVFTQWENQSSYLNPALTGNYEGLIRFRTIHRNQWNSILQDHYYKTTAASVEYKFSKGSSRKVSIGAFTLFDKAGETKFTTKSFNISTSIVQTLGNLEEAHHSIGFGLNAGRANRNIDIENLRWPSGMADPDINEEVNFSDLSAGLLWKYKSDTHFSFQLGSSLHHINNPNVSFYNGRRESLYHRFNFHGNVEIPFSPKISVIPSFLYVTQGPHDQLIIGVNNKWYLTSTSTDFVKLGVFAKSNDGINGREISIYGLSAIVEINSILLGFSIDRSEFTKSNSYEFSLGYILTKPKSINEI